MTIYRGSGGTGEARTDTDITEVRTLMITTEGYKNSAATSADAAEASAIAAAASEAAAAASEAAAATSETNAATSATNATSSASSAGSSASSASSSATSAAASASAALSSELAAADSATAAASSASAAATSEDNAATSETNAASSATAAASSASAASTSASNASSSASAASAAQAAAEAAQAAAEAAQEAIDGSYLGVQASDPSLDLNGDPVTTGDWYYNSTTDVTRIYDGSVWVNGAVSTSSFLLSGNNLSDLGSAATARTNLGLGTAATTSSTDYATAAQGALADSAIQAADLGTAAYTASTDYATAAQGTNADTAYGWGNHASAGYASDASVVKLTGDQTVAGVKTLSSNPILSAGTANGVAYLNGSKVLTSGSALTFDGTNLGIGGSPARKLSVIGSGNTYMNINTSDNTSLAGILFGGTSSPSDGQIIYDLTSTSMRYLVGGSEQMRLTSTGLGIGTSSPGYKVDIRTGSEAALNLYNTTATSNDSVQAQVSTFNGTYWNQFSVNASSHLWKTYNTERARIDSSGNLLVGKTATGSTTQGVQLAPAGGVSIFTRNGGAGCIFVGNSSQSVIEFSYSGTTVGSIAITGSSTSYNTSSDYRLKNTIAPMTGALAKVAALKPVTYKWNADGSDGEGFIAHELQEVVPQCVTGEKDAVDADGNPVYQGIDTSFLVATLTAALQEQQAIIEQLKARLDAANL